MKHPAVKTFEMLIFNINTRIVLSLILGIITTFASKTKTICVDNTCYRHFITTIFNLKIISSPYLVSYLIREFIITTLFFFLLWLAVLSFSAWLHSMKVFPDLFIPTFIVFILIFFIGVTSESFKPFLLKTGAVECVSDDDCILTGFCGEVCASKYHPVYTSFSENCTPLKYCSCVNHKCVGSR
ncbi:MAG: hypothetical protein J7K22_02390 [Nanoarchaeota archaeon]|nr:hypothetical protein [Nanoarchaeota archaeon]